MIHIAICNWCGTAVHTIDGPGRMVCPTCSHRADLPRLACDCPHCGSLFDAAETAELPLPQYDLGGES